MLWLCLRFPLLPVELIAQKNTQQAIAIIEQQRIYQCNLAATDQGIKAQMPVTLATTLWPDLKIVDRCSKREQKALQILAYWSHNYTPAVTLLPPDSLLLEIQGSLKLFRGLGNLLSRIYRDLKDQGYTSKNGLAPTPKAAFLLTYSSIDSASYFDNKSGLLQQTALFQQQLQALPLSVLACKNALKTKFTRTGFYYLKEILPLPAAAIGKRYGKDFLQYLQQITGQLADPQQTIKLPEYFAGELHFSNSLETADMLLFPMKRLLQSLSGYLQGRQLHCSRLIWQLRQNSHTCTDIIVSLSKPQNNLTHFLSLSRLQLEQTTLHSPVESLALLVKDLNPADYQANDLFAGISSSNSRTPAGSTSELLDRLIVRLGADAVKSLALQDSHIPEQAWRSTPPLQSAPATSDTDQLPNSRPAWLLPQPAPVQFRGQQLYWRGPLQLLQGPERIEGNWWHQPICRDYFIARHQNGVTCWLYHDRLNNGWFLHGIF